MTDSGEKRLPAKLKAITDRYLAEMQSAGAVCACAGYQYDDGPNWSGWTGGFTDSGPPFMSMLEHLLEQATPIDPVGVEGACIVYLEGLVNARPS